MPDVHHDHILAAGGGGPGQARVGAPTLGSGPVWILNLPELLPCPTWLIMEDQRNLGTERTAGGVMRGQRLCLNCQACAFSSEAQSSISCGEKEGRPSAPSLVSLQSQGRGTDRHPLAGR